MIEPLPKWIMMRYSKLWEKFRSHPFSHDQAVKFLKDKEQVVSVFLSDLRKAGWLEVTLSEKDTRHRFYKLKSPVEAVSSIAKGK